MIAVPYQEAPDPPVSPALRRACARAVHVIRADGEVFAAGRAVLFVLGELGHHRLAAILSARPLVWWVELAYRVVARHRASIGRLLRRARR